MYIKNHKVRHKIDNWLRAWVAIAGNIVIILTFTIVYPNWEFNMAFRQFERDSQIRKLSKEDNKC